ncbi:hypothetical protein E2C01_032613 [Portunus trituberculatus]|uniref:Uncharacterized protein n=1 Tax=Portunus trituberculatus TaxID=210409 RepID=A0A5B7F3A2_PORTR|nr:hypothetical protein [Portunus trituberculatus]
MAAKCNEGVESHKVGSNISNKRDGSLEKASAAGALITDADRRWAGFTPNDMYAAMTEPATVANPPVRTACSSDLVIWGMNGLMSSELTEKAKILSTVAKSPNTKPAPSSVKARKVATLPARHSNTERPKGHRRMIKPRMNCRAMPQATWRHLTCRHTHHTS